jgi:hypothetical protein
MRSLASKKTFTEPQAGPGAGARSQATLTRFHVCAAFCLRPVMTLQLDRIGLNMEYSICSVRNVSSPLLK